MLELRYGDGYPLVSGVVMLAYTLMIAVTSTIAYGAIFSVLFDIGKVPAILIGSSVVIVYSALGGMWSITLTDFVQFVIKTVSIFFVLLPIALRRAGGFEGLAAHLPAEAFSFTHIGAANIFTYIVLYVPTMVIGQDLWQRVFTARSDRVARWAGFGAAVYCSLYGLAGALIGMAAKVLLPDITARDQVYTQVVRHVLPEGLSGLVVAGALAAIMSTSSGALIATATVAKEDILRALRRRLLENQAERPASLAGAIQANKSIQLGGSTSTDGAAQAEEVSSSRKLVVGFGLVMAAIACGLQDVVAAMTIASDILVGGLLVAVIGGMVWGARDWIWRTGEHHQRHGGHAWHHGDHGGHLRESAHLPRSYRERGCIRRVQPDGRSNHRIRGARVDCACDGRVCVILEWRAIVRSVSRKSSSPGSPRTT